MPTFAPVWLSTDAQLSALKDAYRHASLATKLLGTFRPPADMAYLQGVLTPWMRMPLVFLAEGELVVRDQRIQFSPRRSRIFGWRLRGGQPELAFDLTRTEVTAVDPADFQSPVGGMFDIPFTRVRTTRPGILDNILLCVGGRVNLPRMRKRSIELRNTLERLGK